MELNAQDRIALILGRQLMHIEGQADHIASLTEKMKELTKEPVEDTGHEE